jgi:hypothetical protein
MSVLLTRRDDITRSDLQFMSARVRLDLTDDDATGVGFDPQFLCNTRGQTLNYDSQYGDIGTIHHGSQFVAGQFANRKRAGVVNFLGDRYQTLAGC